MIGLALFQPEIPQNTGTLLRLGACLGISVDIIEPCGFALSDRQLKRAGMDYISQDSYRRWQNWATFHGTHDQGKGGRLVLVTPEAKVAYTDFQFYPNDILVMGRESDGFPPEVLGHVPHQVSIPMYPENRSLNIAIAASMVVGEALRQTKGFYTQLTSVSQSLAPQLFVPQSSLLSSQQQAQAKHWFEELQTQIIQSLEMIEKDFPGVSAETQTLQPGKFARRLWTYSGEGGGTSAVLKGRIFEKAGVNVSCIKGKFSGELRQKIPGAMENPEFWATGLSLVIHPWSPFIPTIHMNTRLIQTTKYWFGGGIDVTPMGPNFLETDLFHQELKAVCDQTDITYYPRFKAWCDTYFHLAHRQEMRGIGGIFYDQLQSQNWEKDFIFTQAVGKFFLSFYPKIVRQYAEKSWSDQDRLYQLIKRGRYVEYNLLYDRGTLFGLKTGGDIDAILMSLPPHACWL